MREVKIPGPACRDPWKSSHREEIGVDVRSQDRLAEAASSCPPGRDSVAHPPLRVVYWLHSNVQKHDRTEKKGKNPWTSSLPGAT